MIEMYDDAWEALRAIRSRLRTIQSLDILTGFLGAGANRVLAQLGPKQTRIIFGLERQSAPLGKTLADELSAPRDSAEVWTCRGLHAKVFILNRRAVVLGSANLTRSGFEHLHEAVLATDSAGVVRRCVTFFDSIRRQSKPLPKRIPIRKESTAELDRPEIGAIGLAPKSRRSPFSVKTTRPTQRRRYKRSRPVQHSDCLGAATRSNRGHGCVSG